MEDAKDMEDIGKFDICSSHNFNYQVFEEQIIKVLREVCKKYTNMKKLEEILNKSKTKQIKEFDIKEKIDFFNNSIEKENKKLEIMYEDRLLGIITGEEYVRNSNRIRDLIKECEKNIKELELEISNKKNSLKNENKLDNLINEFLTMKKPSKEIIREFIEKVEIHNDKQVDIYFNFKPLQEFNEKFCIAKKKYEKKCQ